MPYLVGPTAITGAVFTVEPPAAAGVSVRNFDRVVLTNASPYLLKLSNGGNQGFLAPFTVNVYPYDPDTAQITITPTLQGVVVVGNPSQLTAEFYRIGEPLDNRTYPAPASLFSTINAFASSQLVSGSFVTGVAQTFDVSAFASYQLRYNWTGGTANTIADLLLEWLDATGNVVFTESIKFVSVNSVTLGLGGNTTRSPTSLITDGCRGDTLRITATFASGAVTIALNASSRAVDRFRITQPTTHEAANRLLSSETGFLVNAGAVSSIYWGGPQPGPALLRINSSGAKYQVDIFTGQTAFSQRVTFQFPTSAEYIQELLLPRAPVGVQITNNDTANATFRIELVSTND